MASISASTAYHRVGNREACRVNSESESPSLDTVEMKNPD